MCNVTRPNPRHEVVHYRHVFRYFSGFAVMGEKSVDLKRMIYPKLITLCTVSDFLDDRCLWCGEHLLVRAASDHLESKHLAVRERWRQHLSETTGRQPDANWLNTPDDPKVGRLARSDLRKDDIIL